MDARTKTLACLLALAAPGCGAVVTGSSVDAAPDAPSPVDASRADAPPVSDVAPAPDVAPPPITDACEVVRAACVGAPRTLVRGRATGLAVPDGALARFAIRYIPRDDASLADRRDVVVASARVQGGAFEACVCVPRGANVYPQVAAVVLAPGASGTGARDVLRGYVSQRYATLGEEDLSMGLAAAPSPARAEAALSAMDDRALALTARVPDLDDGAHVVAGVIADGRPVAAQLTWAMAADGRAALSWNMAGRALPNERVALLIDRNRDRRCDPGDEGVLAPITDGAELDAAARLRGDALAAVCAALALDDSREE